MKFSGAMSRRAESHVQRPIHSTPFFFGVAYFLLVGNLAAEKTYGEKRDTPNRTEDVADP
jgi:hypothetical protein